MIVPPIYNKVRTVLAPVDCKWSRREKSQRVLEAKWKLKLESWLRKSSKRRFVAFRGFLDRCIFCKRSTKKDFNSKVVFLPLHPPDIVEGNWLGINAPVIGSLYCRYKKKVRNSNPFFSQRFDRSNQIKRNTENWCAIWLSISWSRLPCLCGESICWSKTKRSPFGGVVVVFLFMPKYNQKDTSSWNLCSISRQCQGWMSPVLKSQIVNVRRKYSELSLHYLKCFTPLIRPLWESLFFLKLIFLMKFLLCKK